MQEQPTARPADALLGCGGVTFVPVRRRGR